MINSTDIHQARILIVDDQEANVLVLEQTLQADGYSAITTTMEPDQVCELYLTNHYDLILLDLMMPRMDGFAVMENLRTIDTSGYLPVLVITAQSDQKVRALKAGAMDFISKPFELAEVLVRVHNMLEVRLLHLETRKLYAQVLAEKNVSERLLQKLLPQFCCAGGEQAPGDDPRMPGCSAEVTALFMDLVDFTHFSEGADAEVLGTVLTEIAGWAQSKAGERGLLRRRILEDAYLEAGGLPDPLTDRSLATTEKALALCEAVDRFNANGPFRLKLRLALAGPGD